MNLPDAIDVIRPSIVQINFTAIGLDHTLGTGFLVSESGYVITAQHVIDAARQLETQTQADTKNQQVGFAIPNTENMRANFTRVGYDIVAEDIRHDLALLKLHRNPFQGEISSRFAINGKDLTIPFGTAALNTHRPREGAAIAISGYPLEAPVLVTNAGVVASAWETTIQQIPIPGAPVAFTQTDIADSYLADAQCNPGNSGGPVYLIETGSVIGVCVRLGLREVIDQDHNPVVLPDGRQLLHDTGISIIVPAQYVVALLGQHNLSYKGQDQPKAKQQSKRAKSRRSKH